MSNMRARRKAAGLVNLQAWIPADRADAVRDILLAASEILSKDPAANIFLEVEIDDAS